MSRQQEVADSVSGMSLEEAQALIENEGFRMRVRYQDGVSSKADNTPGRDRIDLAVKENVVIKGYVAQ